MRATLSGMVVMATCVFTMVVFAATYYVNGSWGDDSWEGLSAVPKSAKGPKKTIQAGIDASTDGDTVIIADGTYTGDGNRDLDFAGRGITLRSENGPETCIIDCEGTESEYHRGIWFLLSEGPESVFEGFTITGGYYTAGGAIYLYRSSPTIRDCRISGNSTNWAGGGIYCYDGSPAILSCVISGNSAAEEGGGMWLYGNHVNYPVITNCAITGNEAGDNGGGICCHDESNAIITNCTITGNAASCYGGGICFSSLTDPSVTNTILWDNLSPRGHEIALLWPRTSSVATIRYCDIERGESEIYAEYGFQVDLDGTNIDTDPMLTPDRHLRPGSPCIDWCPTGAADDIDGEARPLDVLGGSNHFDIGRDEFVDSDGDSLPDWWEARYYDSAVDDPDADGLNNLGEYESGTDPDNPDCDGDGRNDGTEFTDGSNPLFHDNAEKTWYVDGACGDDFYDGLSSVWTGGVHGPKLTIQAGIDAAPNGWDYAVEVADGTYTGTGNKDLDFKGKSITLKSRNGAEKTIIDCEDSGCGFFFQWGERPDSVVDGFTVTNANPVLDGSGVYCYGSSPTITNCIIRGNRGNSYGGGICCWLNSNAVITNCVITGNTADLYGGGICCLMSDATITNCLITGNAADGSGAIECFESNATITNCTITGNMAYEFCGGICCGYDSAVTMTGCILWGNIAATAQEIALGSTSHPSSLTVRYSDVEGGAAGADALAGCTLDIDGTNIDADPLFVKEPLHDYYLSQIASGQTADSPCVDAGSDTAVNLGLDDLSTRTDGIGDEGIVDMGYHAPYVLWASRIERVGSDIIIYWNALPGVSYTVQWSGDMETWNDVLVGETSNWTDVGGALVTRRFYRVLESE